MFENPLIWYLLSFIIFCVGVAPRIYGVVNHNLDTKKKDIEAELSEARRLRDEAQVLLNGSKRDRLEATTLASEILDRATHEAAQIKEQAHQDIADFSELQHKQLKEKIDALEKQAFGNLKIQFTDTLLTAVSKELAPGIPAQADKSLALQTINAITGKI